MQDFNKARQTIEQYLRTHYFRVDKMDVSHHAVQITALLGFEED